MNLKRISALSCLLVLATNPVIAQSMLEHRTLLSTTSESSLAQRLPVPWFISFLSPYERGQNIRSADGSILLNISDSVSSIYDPTTSYDVGRFFKPQGSRLSFIVNWGPITGTVWSVGIDTGYRSQKLKLNPSIFFGTTSSWQTGKNQTISFGLGAWLGGKVNETPCLDDYDREYSCSTLTAWADKNPVNQSSYKYLDLRFKQLF